MQSTMVGGGGMVAGEKKEKLRGRGKNEKGERKTEEIT